MINKNTVLLVVTMSYDGDTPVYVFDRHDTYQKNFDEAVLYMKNMYESTFDEEHRESVIGLDKKQCCLDMDEGYACIQWNDGDKEEMKVTYPSEPIEYATTRKSRLSTENSRLSTENA